MNKLIYTRKDELLAWAGQVIGTRFDSSAQAIGLERDGALRAVSVFDHFSEGDCAIHIGSDGSRRWLTPHFLLASFAYPFITRRQNRLTSLIPEWNFKSLKFCRSCGFTEEGRLREGAAGGIKSESIPDSAVGKRGEVHADLIIMGLLRDECRWIAPAFVSRVKEHPHG